MLTSKRRPASTQCRPPVADKDAGAKDSRQASSTADKEIPEETFDFLGFTHYCSRTKDGRRFRMKRVTSRKKSRAKLAAMKEWLKQKRIMPTQWIMRVLGLKLRGHYQYYGVTDNYRGVARFHREVRKLLYKWLNRRSQRRSYTWAAFEELLKVLPLPQPRARVAKLTSIMPRKPRIEIGGGPYR
jgi:hypothetical protein